MYESSLSIMTMRKMYWDETSIHFVDEDKEKVDETGLLPLQFLSNKRMLNIQSGWFC